MAKQDLKKIFLSASIPSPDRDKEYYETADIVAIRDAVRALATVVIPKAHLIWGGHPSITPMIRYVMERMNANLRTHITIYQSLFFEKDFLADNFSFENIILTPKLNDQDASLLLMRKKLIEDNDFSVGIFIGGMKGILDEFELFTTTHPNATILPIASTGGAAKILYNSRKEMFGKQLESDYAYMALFRDLLKL